MYKHEELRIGHFFDHVIISSNVNNYNEKDKRINSENEKFNIITKEGRSGRWLKKEKIVVDLVTKQIF